MSTGLLSATVQVVLPNAAAASETPLLAGAPIMPMPTAVPKFLPAAATELPHPRSAPQAPSPTVAVTVALFNDTRRPLPSTPVETLRSAAPMQPVPAAMLGTLPTVVGPSAANTTRALLTAGVARADRLATVGLAASPVQRPQPVTPTRRLEAGAGIRRPKPQRVLMIVNSNVRYWKPYQLLMNSLVKVGFERWRDVIVVFGGSKRDVPPYEAPADAAPKGVLFVNLTLDNFDLNGLSALYKYRSRGCLRADSYFYLHDSTEAAERFPQMFNGLSRGVGFLEVRIPSPPSSNIMVFGTGLVEKYGDNFDVNMTKWEGIQLEGSKDDAPVQGVRPLTYFAQNVTRIGNREIRGDVDVYGTGFKRKVVWYPMFNLYKYILWQRFGDLGEGGNVRNVDASGQKPRR